jgi:hypothetical protein
MIGKRATKLGLTRGANRRPMLFSLKFSSGSNPSLTGSSLSILDVGCSRLGV